MKPVVTINNPCPESWEKMNPEEQGRFCDQCCKVVVDFTQMPDEAIVQYLRQKSEQKICGRFKAAQVAELPKRRIRFSFNIQRFAAAVFLAFGSFLFASCSSSKPREHEIMGDVAYIPDTTVIVSHTADSTRLAADTTKAQSSNVIPENEIYLQGDVSIFAEEAEEVQKPHCGHDPREE